MRAAALRTYRQLLQAAWARDVRIGPVDETLERADGILRAARIRFAITGGFAVMHHGYERFTKDEVELLVLGSDLPRATKVLRAAGFTGVLTRLGARMRDVRTNVRVDLKSASESDRRALAQTGRRRLPVIPVEHLVLMKLETNRAHDDADVVELLKAGTSSAKVIRWLRRTRPELLPRFRALAARARAERIPTPRGPRR